MKRIQLQIIITLVAFSFLFPIYNAGAAEKTYTIKFATAHPPQIPSGSLLLELEKVIPERTNGRVKLKAYLGSSLYGDYAAPPQVASGALEMSYGGFNLSSVSPGWNTISGLPFVIDSYEHYLRLTKTEAFKKMISNLEAKGIKHIADAGYPDYSDVFNSKRDVKTLEDFKGLKMRVPPIPGLVKMCEVFGVQNVTIDMAEVAAALQTGIVDGTFAPILKLKGYNLTKNTPFATRAGTTFIPQTFAASTKFWNSLPPDLQKILKSVFEEYGEKCNQQFAVLRGKFWEIYEKAPGTKITVLAEEEKKKWQKSVRSIWEEEASKSDESRMILEAIEATR